MWGQGGPSDPPSSRALNRRRSSWIGVGIAALLVLASCGGGQPRAATSPTASPNRLSQAQDYVRVVNEFSLNSFDLWQQAMSCQSGDLICLRPPFKGLSDAVTKTRSDLSNLPVPACLIAADVDFRAALDDYQTTADVMLKRIDTDDASLVAQCRDKALEADAHMRDASDHLYEVELRTC
jgi:hypothetical protein